MVQPGTILAGKYQVERVLGQGGMGCVVSAMHLQLGQRVAIKFLLPEALRIPEAVERFLREARAAVRLKSEHVGRVIDVGQFDDGAPYMVMEFLEGMDLSQYLHRQGPLAPSHAVDLILQGLEAIAEAHSMGIVHRDLKPANLFLTRRADGGPLVKVLDFGISKASQGAENFSLTRTTAIMGSPGYMSPEQLRSAKDCDARTDIWAVGVILFELTTGRQPFGGDTITELAVKVAIDPTPPMHLPNNPPGFEPVVQRCLAKDVGHRFQNVAELAAALAAFGTQGAYEHAARIARVLQINPSSLHAAAATQYVAPGTPIPGAYTPIPGAHTPLPGVHTGAGTPTTLSSAAGTYSGVGAPKKRTGLVAGLVAVALAGGAVAAVMIAKGGGGGGAASDTAAKQPDPQSKQPDPQTKQPDPQPPQPDPQAKQPDPPPQVAIDAGVEPVAEVTPDAAPAAEPAIGRSDPKADPKKPRKPRKPRRPTTTTTDDEDLSDSRY
jgi:serine/threonine protein kinase